MGDVLVVRPSAGKKAQFYIFTVILLLAFAFSVARPEQPVKKPLGTFQQLYQNYLSESVVVVNSALHNGENLTSTYAAFADSYLAYARSRDPNFRFAYLLVDGSTLVAGNLMDSAVNLTASSATYEVEPGSRLAIPAASSADMLINGISYGFTFTGEAAQVMAVFRKEDKNEVRVHVAQ